MMNETYSWELDKDGNRIAWATLYADENMIRMSLEEATADLQAQNDKLTQAVNDKDLELFESQELAASLLEALENIAGPCENYVGGLAGCFEYGARTIKAEWGANAVCDKCIANKAIRKARTT